MSNVAFQFDRQNEEPIVYTGTPLVPSSGSIPLFHPEQPPFPFFDDDEELVCPGAPLIPSFHSDEHMNSMTWGTYIPFATTNRWLLTPPSTPEIQRRQHEEARNEIYAIFKRVQATSSQTGAGTGSPAKRATTSSATPQVTSQAVNKESKENKHVVKRKKVVHDKKGKGKEVDDA